MTDDYPTAWARHASGPWHAFEHPFLTSLCGKVQAPPVMEAVPQLGSNGGQPKRCGPCVKKLEELAGNEEAAGGGERSPTPAATGGSSVIQVPPVNLIGVASIKQAVQLVGDRETSFEDRAALYAKLYELQLEINRTLRKAKSDIAYRMVRDGISQAGQLRVKHVARKVSWPINEEPSWTHDEAQAALRELRNDPITRSFVRYIPTHLELNTLALAAAVQGQPWPGELEGQVELRQQAARNLYAQLRRHRWRVELEGEEALQVMPRPIARPDPEGVPSASSTEESET